MFLASLAGRIIHLWCQNGTRSVCVCFMIPLAGRADCCVSAEQQLAPAGE